MEPPEIALQCSLHFGIFGYYHSFFVNDNTVVILRLNASNFIL